MKQEISSLVDGELTGPEAERAIRACSLSDEHKDAWNTYHLIGEVMRGHMARTLERNALVVEALEKEPTVLAPRTRPVLETALGRVAMAAAASVAAIGMVSWIGTQGGAPGVSTPLVAKGGIPAGAAIKPVSATATVTQQPTVELQEYLTAHRQIPSSEAYRPVANQKAAPAR
jgi:sigma-E factor negative regulatory protein RseA